MPESAERCTAPEKSGVKIDTTISVAAKTVAKAAMIDSSQLSPRKSPTTGISRMRGSTEGAKKKATKAAATHPAMARVSRTKPRE